MSEIKRGFVYLATNESMKDLVKIGMTFKPVEERLKEISGTGVPTLHVCRFSCEVDNPREVESRLHNLFKYCRVNSKKEFFAVDWQAAMVALLLLVKSPNEAVDAMKKISDKVGQAFPETQKTSDNKEGQSKEEQYKEYVRSTVKDPDTVDIYHNALLNLDKNRDKTGIGKNIYDIESVLEAQEIKDRLLENGDLYEFNKAMKNGYYAMSGAMGKYIEFLQKAEVLESKESITPEHTQSVTHYEDISEQYKAFVRSTVKTDAVPDVYHNALLHLDKNRDKTGIDKNIYDIESVLEAQKIKIRLSLGGDLHEFNVDFQASAMGAAMGKYIGFLLLRESE